MKTEILKFDYRDKLIEFETKNGSNVMVNATQMAKLFDKEVSGFLKTDNTKNFIEVYCRKEDIPSQNEFSPKGKLIKVIKSGRNNGTWMNRIVALKFAAWLDPFFELWVYSTIDGILFGYYKSLEKSLKLSADRKKEIYGLKEKLNDSPEFQRLQILELEEKQAAYARGKQNRNQLDMFMAQ